MKSAVQVTILVKTFTVRSDASADAVQKVAAFVNDKLGEVTCGQRSADSLNAALLTLLNVAGDYLQLRDGGGEAQRELATRLARLSARIEKAAPVVRDGRKNTGAEPAQLSLCTEI